MSDMFLRARIFMAAADSAEAGAHDSALLSALAAFAPRSIHAPAPYWKEPGWYEHYFELAPADQSSFDAIVALSGKGWHITRDGECDAVWNPSPSHAFLLPGVHWAQILLIFSTPTTHPPP
jgi:hypothetical protein